MNQQLLDRETVEATRPEGGGSAPTRRRSPQEQQQRRPAGHEGGRASEAARSTEGASPPERLSATERRSRSEALAHKLADAPDLDALVAIVQEHGRRAVARAAAVRPDLVPEINGEFVHIALSLADLD